MSPEFGSVRYAAHYGAARPNTPTVYPIGYQTYSTIPVYETASKVQIQDERTTQIGNLNANDPAFWQDSEPYYTTQYSIMKSRGLALTKEADASTTGPAYLTLTDPDGNPVLIDQHVPKPGK